MLCSQSTWQQKLEVAPGAQRLTAMESYPHTVSINVPPPGRYEAAPPCPMATAFGRVEAPGLRREPRDFVLWSYFNTLFCCNPLCLGFIALVFSIKARDEKIARQPLLAGKYGKTAMYLNIAAFVLGVLLIIVTLVLLFLYVSSLHYIT
ncbi:interferon-induced transmembrane protein 1-like [Rhea pennata]|uniref:interferon-induced transmembrane protein 1-like n=1 Tax=Rhea pennata TaxID=8795 RepID=UPI002E25E306